MIARDNLEYLKRCMMDDIQVQIYQTTSPKTAAVSSKLLGCPRTKNKNLKVKEMNAALY